MLKKLGFVTKRKNGIQYYYYYQDQMILTTSIHTGEGDIRKGTANAIRSQMKLCPEQFKDAYDCPMRADEYLGKLRSKPKLISD